MPCPPEHFSETECVAAVTPAGAARLDGDGGMAARLASFDWSGSALGEPDNWPESLRLMLDVCIGSDFPIAVWWGPQLLQLYNDAYRAILGAARHPAALGRPAHETWPEAWDTIGPMVRQVMAEGRAVKGEDMPLYLERSGYRELCFFTFSYSPIRELGGAVVGMFTAAIETTARVLAERRAAFQLELADRLRLLYCPDRIVEAGCALLGERLGVARVMFAAIDDADGVSFGAQLATALRSATPVAIGDVAHDARTCLRAAAYRDSGVRALLAIPLQDAGAPDMVLVLHQDQPRHWSQGDIELAQHMAERTWQAAAAARTRAELRDQRDQGQYVLDSMTEGVVLLDRDWTLVGANAAAARIARRSRSELIGRNYSDVFGETLGGALEGLCRRVRDSGNGETLEFEHTFPDLPTAWLDLRACPSRDGGLAVFFRDISERKRVEAEMREASRRKDEFLAMLAHELRNPLAPISAASELMQMAPLDAARMKRTSEVISRQVRHLTGLVDDLLDVSRVTRGLVTIGRSPQDINTIVASAVEQVQPAIAQRRHRLRIAPAQGGAPVLVSGDQKRLVQVLVNLLSNAAKYTAANGDIALDVEAGETEVALRVADNGIGIAPDLQPRVFDLFSQAERTADRAQGGLGLGLALVRSLVRLHGGSVDCESAGPGAGSTFTVRLPRLAPAAPACASVAALPCPACPPAKKTLRILVVDDNVDAARMLAMYLEALGHEVLVESESLRALARAGATRPDVVVLDIGLPEMNGNELASRLRAEPATTGSVLIAVTGYGQEHDRKTALAAGFDHHFVKPVDTAALCSLLAEVDAR